MRFETIRYLDWARRRFDMKPPAYNLAASGMQAASIAEAGIDLGALRIQGSNAFGHPELCRKLSALYDVPATHVLPAAGTSFANFLLLAALIRPGDVALCEWPAYEPLWRVLETLGAQVKYVQRRAENQFVPDLSAIAEGFAQGARVLVLSDLHNPSATLLSRDVVREIGQIARRYDAWVLIDEVYLSSVFDQDLKSGAQLGERIVITASLTKSYGLGGLRAGWAIAPAEVVARAHDVNAYLVANAPFIADEVAAQALDHLPQLRERAARRRAETWPIVRAFAVERGMLPHEPAGAFIVWLKLPAGLDCDRLVDHLSDKYDTLVVPGSFFGARDHIRLGYALGPVVVTEGLRRLGMALDELAT